MNLHAERKVEQTATRCSKGKSSPYLDASKYHEAAENPRS